jgi:hypothetical protein
MFPTDLVIAFLVPLSRFEGHRYNMLFNCFNRLWKSVCERKYVEQL